MQARSKRQDERLAEQRRQLIDGFCAAVEDKGVAATTIDDVARLSRTSKRTFYEHFADKDDCFVAAYRELAADVMHAVVAAAGTEQRWEAQLEAAVEAYVTALDERPALTRAFFLEVHAAGPKALQARRDVLGQFAGVTRELADEARRREPSLRPLSPAMAMAIVGGINELMLLKAERSLRARELAETALTLVRAVVTRNSD